MRLLKCQRGASAVEYGLLVGLISVTVMGALTIPYHETNSHGVTVSGSNNTVGAHILDQFNHVTYAFNKAQRCSTPGQDQGCK